MLTSLSNLEKLCFNVYISLLKELSQRQYEYYFRKKKNLYNRIGILPIMNCSSQNKLVNAKFQEVISKKKKLASDPENL